MVYCHLCSRYLGMVYILDLVSSYRLSKKLFHPQLLALCSFSALPLLPPSHSNRQFVSLRLFTDRGFF